jgi:hypothetical protein
MSVHWSSVPKLLGVALANTFLGFGLVKSSSLFADATNTDIYTTFGSPEDIEKAIHELHTVLAAAQVSTDPGDLQSHGFSSNDHHQGLCISFNRILYLSEMCNTQGWITVSSSTQNRQKTWLESSRSPQSIETLIFLDISLNL